MITTAPSEFKDHFSSYVEQASEQDIVLEDHGRHVAILTELADEDEYLEYRLLDDPQFQRIIEEARKDASAGRVTRLEDLE
ncbi:MAG: Antitoxin Phd_YefM, type II toxin-antitoxin system [Candidatus Kentron sp. G]|nr:MAG: Antitoxin Phd_YefM, type II toxin-antitoxin system [Candidatus Kentron sp. G]VFN05933.1 MAG: Antitoxin Phd_YefM, type II toxin-antitoxin system [Candidatus Kentron sp. G]VFN06411.1 MAG: Antitoxin Phd_YefM, type II toxin-antitoxin system [Candidatus Kentron sp. G]